MGMYENQAVNYKNNATKIVQRLEEMQIKYEDLLAKIVLPKEGDYLTEHVIEELEKEVEDIKTLISDINNRCTSISAKAHEIDERILKEQKEKEKKEQDSAEQ